MHWNSLGSDGASISDCYVLPQFPQGSGILSRGNECGRYDHESLLPNEPQGQKVLDRSIVRTWRAVSGSIGIAHGLKLEKEHMTLEGRNILLVDSSEEGNSRIQAGLHEEVPLLWRDPKGLGRSVVKR